MSADCGHESGTGTAHPDVWICDGCDAVTAYVDDPYGSCVIYSRDGRVRKVRLVTIAAGAWRPDEWPDDIGCPPGCVSPFCDCPGTR